MDKRNNKLELLGSAPIPKALMALGIPIMIGMLINAFYNLADAYFVGGLGESQMGAISIVFPLGQVVVGLGLMFGNGAVLNIGLNPVFIYTFGFGVAGAAAATAISQFVFTMVYVCYVVRGKSAFSFSVKNFAPDRQMMSEILKIGIPTLTFQILTSLSIALINRAAGNYGDAVIAGLFMAAFPVQMIGQFTKGSIEMISVGQRSLWANGLSLFFFGFYTVYSSLLLALGRGKAGFFLGACRQGICFVPVILFLPLVWGVNGIVYAQPLADVLSAFVTVFVAIRLHRELAETEN